MGGGLFIRNLHNVCECYVLKPPIDEIFKDNNKRICTYSMLENGLTYLYSALHLKVVYASTTHIKYKS